MSSEPRSPETISPDEAVQLARELYGLEVGASPLPGEYDNNFHLTTSDCRAFVLKVMHTSRERAFIDMQCAALTHIAEHAPDLALQRVQLTRSGETFARTTLRNGEERFVWLLSFLPGRVTITVTHCDADRFDLSQASTEIEGRVDHSVIKRRNGSLAGSDRALCSASRCFKPEVMPTQYWSRKYPLCNR